MDNDPNQPNGNGKPLWPWVLAQFLPSIVIPIAVFTIRPIQRSFDPGWLFIGTYLYGVILSYFFFRIHKNKNVFISLLFSVGAAFIVVAMNIVILISVVFVGCLCALGSGGFR